MMMFFVGCIFIDYPVQSLQKFHQSIVDPQTGLLISLGFNQYFQKVNVYVVILPPHLTYWVELTTMFYNGIYELINHMYEGMINLYPIPLVTNVENICQLV